MNVIFPTFHYKYISLSSGNHTGFSQFCFEHFLIWPLGNRDQQEQYALTSVPSSQTLALLTKS